ncbi:hypothetical protein AB0K48_57120, partial [Nonomuraea sp. NPDC055795]
MTSTLRGGTLRLPATEPPRHGPLPILHGTRVSPGITGADPEMTAQIGYGQPYSLLPYTPQDGYSRTRRERELPVVVLENSQLTATFRYAVTSEAGAEARRLGARAAAGLTEPFIGVL